VLREARAEGLRYVEITTDPDDVPSQREIEANGGAHPRSCFQGTTAYSMCRRQCGGSASAHVASAARCCHRIPRPRSTPAAPWNLDPVDVVAEKHERITTIRLEFELRKQVDNRRQGRT
jgi:hypothetical protein